MKSSKKKGLGRGLSALFGDQKNDTQSEIINTTQKTASIGDLNRNRFQPRINFDKMKISELAASIKKNGLIQPIAVR
jgi:ParB family chromosome partitioning protein